MPTNILRYLRFASLDMYLPNSMRQESSNNLDIIHETHIYLQESRTQSEMLSIHSYILAGYPANQHEWWIR